MFNPTDVIGPYEITASLGQGGMSTVYRARRRINDQPLALKILSPQLASDDKHVSAFFSEAIRVEPLQHKHIIQVYNYGSVIASASDHDNEQILSVDGHVHYIAMAYARAGTLKQQLAGNGQGGQKLAWRKALTISKQIALALQHTHDRGLIHCDVKPSNILCLSKGHYVLSDFGIARRTGERTSTVMGTPEYMSPEQCDGNVLDDRSDQYALGVVLYEMLAGRPPFTASEAAVVLHKQREQAPPPLTQYNPQLPKGVLALVNRALEKQADDRFADMGALIAALDQQLNRGVGGLPRWVLAGLGGLILIGGALFSLGLLLNSRQPVGVLAPASPTVLAVPKVAASDTPVVLIPGGGLVIATVGSSDLIPLIVASPTVTPTLQNIRATSTLAPLPTNTPIPPRPTATPTLLPVTVTAMAPLPSQPAQPPPPPVSCDPSIDKKCN